MSEDVTKLPKWAQWKINQLERELDRLKEQYEAITSDAGDHEVGISWSCGLDPNKQLPKSAVVRFISTQGEIDIMLREKDSIIDINASNHGLRIEPRACNSFYLHFNED